MKYESAKFDFLHRKPTKVGSLHSCGDEIAIFLITFFPRLKGF